MCLTSHTRDTHTHVTQHTHTRDTHTHVPRTRRNHRDTFLTRGEFSQLLFAACTPWKPGAVLPCGLIGVDCVIMCVCVWVWV
jgi:hypothetical protein